MLQAISPIDGRYNQSVKELIPYFSESALIKYRIFVEIEYFIRLCDVLPQLFSVTPEQIKLLRTRISKLNINDLNNIKDIESKLNHDVKAVEYFIKDIFDETGLSEHKEFVHFGLTSQDINNMAYPLMMKDCHENVIIPIFESVINKLIDLYRLWIEVPMLARTHGQVATPTKLGKEILVFIKRLESAFIMLNEVPFSCKFGGATGNLNAHYVAYPNINWNRFSENFSKELNLVRSFPTTQIEHYDHMAAYFDAIKRINNILIDLSRDFWQYISINYFTQKVNPDEVGSSAMPHKVNPIDFENAEGNLGIANAIFEHLSSKLPISRLQRDLTDSTVLRNIGVPIAHTIISFKSLLKGLQKIDANFDVILSDLDNNWQVVAEAIQTILRREKVSNPYEKLKKLTRGEKVTQKTITDFINSLDISDEVKTEMLKISPRNYTGI
jgi:adenylosuccinate lyase